MPRISQAFRIWRRAAASGGVLLAVVQVLTHGARADALAGPAEPILPAGIEEVVFAARPYCEDGHYYANFGYYGFDANKKVFANARGGRLCRLNLRTGVATDLLNDPDGAVRDPQVHYDGRRVLFAYRRGGTDHYHLYELDLAATADAATPALRQLTDGPYDDVEPTYLPDGDIVFCSTRCNRWVLCWKVPVAILYRCAADGSDIRMLSSNAVTENTPAVLPDGRILYTRWEYVERSQLCYHHLWTVHADGTGQMVYYGNMHPVGMAANIAHRDGSRVVYGNVPGDVAMLDAKPIPGTGNIVAVFSPGHGRREHMGHVTVVDPRRGPDDLRSAVRVHPGDTWRDPYPVAADRFLVANERALHLMDTQGRTRVLWRLDDPRQAMRLHEPVPVQPRPRERTPPRRDDPARSTGRLILADVAVGRNMAGVAPGEVRSLLVLEQLPAPFHVSPGFDGISLWGTFSLARILGTVPVEPDGSADFEVPALRSLMFVALDAQGVAVKKMQSFVTVQPGETLGCVGCHEPRTTAPRNPPRSALLALQRPTSRVEPVPGVPEIVDFRRHVQPILERHCVRCHGPGKSEAKLRLDAPDSVPSHGSGRVLTSYVELVSRLGEVADGRNAHGNRPPRSMGSGGSGLMTRIGGAHHDVRVSPDEATLVRLWLDSGAAANGTYAVMDGGSPTAPSANYIREMKRFGLLAPAAPPAPVDGYALDEAYWRTLWHRPPPLPWPRSEPGGVPH